MLIENCTSSSISRQSINHPKCCKIWEGQGAFHIKYNIINTRILLEVESYQQKLGNKKGGGGLYRMVLVLNALVVHTSIKLQG